MYKNLLNCLALVMLLPSCSGVTPHISVVCEENNVGNCVVKWETAPLIEGNVKVYASTSPNRIPEENPVAMANIADQRMTIVNSQPARRYYYTLLFNDKYRVKVAARNVHIPDIQNFRDLGGYPVYKNHKTVRWGMLYRSAEIDSLGYFSRRKLRNLGVKTIIDLRTPSETKQKAPLQKNFKVVHIPIGMGYMEDLLQDIRHHRVSNDTVRLMVEQMNRSLVNNYTKEYRALFDILLDKSNYPVVIHCTSGKGRTGIVSALVLSALGVDDDIIMDDYRLSNDYFNIPSASQYAYQLPASSQEAITTIFSARENFLNAAKEEAERNYGDVATYLRKGIGLTKEEIKSLQEILLANDE
ncbi:MAG: tyrosine-protein phosphatase [Bacteroides sp.]|nr:tyrosine-protein phosphatase [Bacteroides sp.]